MGKTKIREYVVAILLCILFAYILIEFLIQVPFIFELLKGYILDDVGVTEATAISIDNNKNITVKYLTPGGEVVSRYNDKTVRASDLNRPIKTRYKKSNPSYIYGYNQIITWACVIFGGGVYIILCEIPFIKNFINKKKTKNWNKKEVELVRLKSASFMFGYEYEFLSDDGDKKRTGTLECYEGLLEYYIKNKLIDKVPIKANPNIHNNKYGRMDVSLDYEELYKKGLVNKPLI